MATILKSDVLYNGDEILSHVNQSLTAQQAFDSYKEWVIESGGIIGNETICLQDFQFMKTWKVLGKVIGVSVNWGIKKDSNGLISSMLSVDRSEFIPTGGIAPTYRTDIQSFPILKFSTGTLMQKSPRKNVFSKQVTISSEAKKISTGDFYVSLGEGVLSNSSDIFIGTPYSTGSVLQSLFVADSMGVAAAAQKTSPYYSGVVGFYDFSQKSAYLYSQGAPIGGYRNVPNMVNLKNANTSRIYIGKRMNAGALLGGSTNDEFTESWIVNDSSPELSVALSAMIDARY